MIKVLIIDDAFFTRRVYSKILSGEYEVIEARDGNEGIEQYLAHDPDLIICDLLMPVKNGFQFLKAYDKINGKAPVIICTSDVQEETREKCFELGADEFIQKPSLTDTKSFLKIVQNSLAADKHA